MLDLKNYFVSLFTFNEKSNVFFQGIHLKEFIRNHQGIYYIETEIIERPFSIFYLTLDEREQPLYYGDAYSQDLKLAAHYTSTDIELSKNDILTISCISNLLLGKTQEQINAYVNIFFFWQYLFWQNKRCRC